MTEPTATGLTLDMLARALRGIPREAPILVRMPDGSLRHVRTVRPVYVAADGTENPRSASTSGQTYAISLEVVDGP